MRILHIVNDYLPNSKAGTEYYISELSEAQMELGYLPSVLYTKILEDSNVNHEPFYIITESEYQNIPTYVLTIPLSHKNLLYNSYLLNTLKPWMQGMDFSLVHIHSMINYSCSLIDVIGRHIPVMFTFHDFWLLCANAILIHSAGKVCSGPDTLDKCVECQRVHTDNLSSAWLIQRKNYAAKVMKRVNLGICPSRFSLFKYKKYGEPDFKIVHESLGMKPVSMTNFSKNNGDPVRFTYLGGICWFKGLDVAVSAFRALKINNIILNIYGHISSTHYFEKVMEIANGDSRIQYCGAYSKSDLGSIFESTDCVILPSRIESYSFVVREALSAGVPVIASNAGALSEIVKHGKNGFLFKSGDGADLAMNIFRVAKDPEILLSLKSGIKPVKTIYDDAVKIGEYYRSFMK
ncbi:glycosyltransferase [Desulfonatronovibrio magnus]|uniref:glycosyltransferase n=1 Tax=Desulfonatronovibrio magnus TaxID=698827 RepID=UPI0005EB7A74|nr:glycosyltransferase [Desulfonatronovibrio magnus]